MSAVKKIKKYFKDNADKKEKQKQEQLNRPPKDLMKQLATSDNSADREEFGRLQKKYFSGYLGPEYDPKDRKGKQKTSMDSKDYKAGGYVLSAEDKRRRKAFKSGAGKGKNNTGMKKIKMKEGGMVIVDRNYLKGK
jgi:hypothetical protein